MDVSIIESDARGQNQAEVGELESQSLICLAVFGNILSVAVYAELSNTIYADVIPFGPDDFADIIYNIKVQYSPSLILVHPKTLDNTEIIAILQAGVNDPNQHFQIQATKSSTWHPDSAIDIICDKLYVKDLLDDAAVNPRENFQKIASRIEIDNVKLRQSLGALLHFLQKSVFNLEEGIIRVASVQNITWGKYLIIDSTAMRSLHIFHQDIHPNIYKENQRGKEGFSIFSILDRTNSIPGRSKLREWMQKPLCAKGLIEERQNHVEMMVDSRNRDFVAEISKALRNMQDLPRLLLRIKKVEATFPDWGKIMTSIEKGLHAVNLMIQFLSEDNRALQHKILLRNMIETINVANIQVISDLFLAAFDFKQPQYNSMGIVIREGFDELFDNLRYTYDGIETYLANAAKTILDCSPLLNNVRVEYLPQLGYLVVIDDSEVSVVEHDNSFDFVFKQEPSNYFKHFVVEELDESLGDVKSNMSDRQRFLMLQIEENLIDCEPYLQQLSIHLSSIDAYISLSKIAIEMNFVKPEVVEDNLIIIKNGRHPLQELTVETFVPNDSYISHDKPIALVTGPNNSGKSVYIKQVGVIVYLAHIGSYVPAERAIIGLTDRIMTRIESTETVSSPQSSFSLDLSQVSKMVKFATERSLCLIDEFGKGTTPLDGVSILAATIRFMSSKSLRAIFTLHFTEALDPEILTETVIEKINLFRMDVHTTSSNVTTTSFIDDDEATPLYKLKLGRAPSSQGILCAKQSGVPESIIQRAYTISTKILANETITRLPSKRRKECGIDNPNNMRLLELFLSVSDWNEDNDDINRKLELLKLKLWQ